MTAELIAETPKPTDASRQQKPKRSAIFVLLSSVFYVHFAFCLFPAVAVSKVFDEGTAVSPLPAKSSSGFHGLEALAGPSILKGQVGIGVALRYPVAKDFAVEIGGTLPHQVTGYGSEPGTTAYGTATTRISSFAESHLALSYALYQIPHLTVEAAAGVSVAVMNDYVNGTDLNGSSYILEDHQIIPSPLLQLGASTPITGHLSFRVDAGWIRYSNQKDYPQSVDLTFNGLFVRPAVVWVF